MNTYLFRIQERLWAEGTRFLVWWGSFAALLAGTTNCPCCGRPGCPTGAASAVLLGGIFAALISLFKRQRSDNNLTSEEDHSPPIE